MCYMLLNSITINSTLTAVNHSISILCGIVGSMSAYLDLIILCVTDKEHSKCFLYRIQLMQLYVCKYSIPL